MSTIDKHVPGEFCWVELHTSDGEAAKTFYGDLFGWTPNEVPMGDGQPPYILAEVSGRQAAGIYQNTEVPPAWLAYVCVDSADATTAKAKELGATPTSDPFDVFDLGRMCVIRDPEGAHFALWQPGKHVGTQVAGEQGAPCWVELQTRQRDSAADFYTKLFGWKTKVSPEYLEVHVGDRGVGGMMTMPEGVPAQVPAHWMTYFWVDDVDASVQKANAAGATTYMQPMDIPNVGRFAVLGDPQGAVFAVFKANM